MVKVSKQDYIMENSASLNIEARKQHLHEAIVLDLGPAREWAAKRTLRKGRIYFYGTENAVYSISKLIVP